MNNYKNVFMFKNPIRHFLNTENLKYSDVNCDSEDLNLQGWSSPVDFKIRKQYGSEIFRCLKIPNLWNFYILYKQCKTFDDFENFEIISANSRLNPNLVTGDFKVYTYEKQIQEDLFKLIDFDSLIKFDIKSFYNSIYTHHLIKYTPFSDDKYSYSDRFITSLNNGQTNGILMGSYISLYLAEHILKEIIIDVEKCLESIGIYTKVSHFSDDIYVFCYDKDEVQIKKTIIECLQKHGFEINETKTVKYKYEEYLKENSLGKIWHAIINKQKAHEKNIAIKNIRSRSVVYPYMNFLNQLLYRISKLDTEKSKFILIKNFFKSNYFNNLEVSKYNFTSENLHQLLYLMKRYPETILYIVPKFKNNNWFKKSSKIFFLKNFISETNNSFHEEQIYNYFGWVLVSDGQELSDDQIKKIFKSDNQILQSYIIMYNISNTINLEKYLQDDDSKWFVNYHLIYKQNSSKEVRENLIKKYLLPKSCAVNNGNMKKSAREYVNFYLSNMLACNIFIKRIEQVESEICDYLNDLQQEKEEFSSDSLSIYSDI